MAKGRPRGKTKRQQKREAKIALYTLGGILFLFVYLVGSCIGAVSDDDESPASSVQSYTPSQPYTAPAWTAPAAPIAPSPTRSVKTRTSKPKPTPKRTTPKPKPRKTTPRPAKPDLPTVRPGAFCSPAGARGIYNGTIYTCKGPGQNRWRR